MTTFTDWGGGDHGPSDALDALYEMYAAPHGSYVGTENSASTTGKGWAKEPLYDKLRHIPFTDREGKTVKLPYVRLGKGKKWFSKTTTPRDRQSWLRRHEPWCRLSEDVRVKLSLSGHRRLTRLIDCLLGIEDSFIMSCPEGWYSNLPFKGKIWRWAISLGIHGRSSQNLVVAWKSFSSYVKASVSRSLEPYPKLVSSFPWQRKGKLEPYLLEADGLFWLAETILDGLRTNDQGTRVMHLVSTRGLPAPSLQNIRAGLDDHGEIIAGQRPDNFKVDPDRIHLLWLMGKRLGSLAKSYKQKGWKSPAHLSLSNSASFESPRRKGGRAISIGRRYGPWANQRPSEDSEGQTIFGMPYVRKADIAVFRTMCRPSISDDPESLIESINNFDIEFDLLKFVHKDLIAGLDQYTGFQLLQFALEEGIRVGCIKAKLPYIPKGKSAFNYKLGRPPCVRVSPIGEPGGKVRTITVAEDWLTLLLSPYGHEMVGNLRLLPSARAGLSRAYQAYEWIKRLGHYKDIDSFENLYFLTSDLTQASEYLEHEYLRPLLRGFIEGAGIGSAYMDLCVDLLTSPRVLNGPRGYSWDHKKTLRGSLMGDPGTKSALMLTMLASEEEAYLRYVADVKGKTLQDILGSPDPPAPWRCFASAGDDHIAVGPLKYLRLIKKVLGLNGAVVSQEKAFISKTASFFTEELVLRTPSVRFYHPDPIWKREYGTHLKVEAVKVRLFSPCSKATEVRSETNPAFGKTRDLVQKLSWLDKSWDAIKDVGVSRFYQRMDRYIDFSSPYIYLPKSIGGLNFVPKPYEKQSFDLSRLTEEIPRPIKRAIGMAILGKADLRLQNVLRSYSVGTSFRGTSARTLAEEQIKTIFEMVGDSLTEDQLREKLEIPLEEWIRHSRKNRKSEAQRAGYIEFSEALQLFERPTYFKEVLASLPSLLKVESKKILYDDLHRALRESLFTTGLSLEEWKEMYPNEFEQFLTAEKEWFTRQMFLETRAFSLIEGSRSEELKDLPQAQLDEDFKTRSFEQRERDLLTDILEFVTFPKEENLLEEYEQAFEKLVSTWDGEVRFEPPQRKALFVKRERISETLCTLTTPLGSLSQEWLYKELD